MTFSDWFNLFTMMLFFGLLFFAMYNMGFLIFMEKADSSFSIQGKHIFLPILCLLATYLGTNYIVFLIASDNGYKIVRTTKPSINNVISVHDEVKFFIFCLIGRNNQDTIQIDFKKEMTTPRLHLHKVGGKETIRNKIKEGKRFRVNYTTDPETRKSVLLSLYEQE